MKRRPYSEHLPRRYALRSVSQPMRWVFSLYAWLFIWTPFLFLLFWWQVSPFISVSFGFLGLAMVIFIMIQYGRTRAMMTPPRERRVDQTHEPNTCAIYPLNSQPGFLSPRDDEQFQVPYPE